MSDIQTALSGMDGSILTELRFLREDISELKVDFRDIALPRREWDQRNHHVDAKIAALGSKVHRLEQETADSRAPWWTYLTMFVAVGALLWSMFAPTTGG